ncbi:MAG: hypothetical protein ABSH34_26630 [Verrucomicrobiota bacterium]
MNAVLIYDDFVVAAKANGALKRSAHRSDEAIQWNVMPWRLDMLKLSPMAAEALAEAAHAHLIVLALRQPESIPIWLMDWLEQWARGRQVQDAVLAVRDGGNADTLPAWAMPKLSQFAERHGLSFVFDHSGPTEEGLTPLARRRQEREPCAADEG